MRFSLLGLPGLCPDRRSALWLRSRGLIFHKISFRIIWKSPIEISVETPSLISWFLKKSREFLLEEETDLDLRRSIYSRGSSLGRSNWWSLSGSLLAPPIVPLIWTTVVWIRKPEKSRNISLKKKRKRRKPGKQGVRVGVVILLRSSSICFIADLARVWFCKTSRHSPSHFRQWENYWDQLGTHPSAMTLARKIGGL